MYISFLQQLSHKENRAKGWVGIRADNRASWYWQISKWQHKYENRNWQIVSELWSIEKVCQPEKYSSSTRLRVTLILTLAAMCFLGNYAWSAGHSGYLWHIWLDNVSHVIFFISEFSVHSSFSVLFFSGELVSRFYSRNWCFYNNLLPKEDFYNVQY